MSTPVKYPNVVVNLSRVDGNAFSIMGAVGAAMERAGIGKQEVKDYVAEATSGDYNNLLRVTARTVNVMTDDDDTWCPGCDWYLRDCRCGDDEE